MLQENAFTFCQRTKTARFYLTKMVDYEVKSQINFSSVTKLDRQNQSVAMRSVDF